MTRDYVGMGMKNTCTLWNKIAFVLATIVHLTLAIPAVNVRPSSPVRPVVPTPSALSDPKDPCGPVVQDARDPTIPIDTCKSKILYSASPATFGASLLNDGSGYDINYGNCFPVISDACAAITSPETPVGAWNWTGIGSYCTIGFWLPQFPGSAPLPTMRACHNQILGPMVDIGSKRGGTAYNQVTVNLRLLPDDLQTGEAVNVGYPTYTITYRPLRRVEPNPDTLLGRSFSSSDAEPASHESIGQE